VQVDVVSQKKITPAHNSWPELSGVCSTRRSSDHRKRNSDLVKKLLLRLRVDEMESLHKPIRQIHPLPRRLRRLIAASQPPNPRYFTKNGTFLLAVAHTVPRPQLPFLHPPSQRLAQQRQRGGQLQALRYISTENKIWLKHQMKLGIKYGFYGWAIFACLMVAGFGWDHERLERLFPSPPEWSFFTRMHFRNGKGQEDPTIHVNQLIDWALAGAAYEQVLKRLEDVQGEGKGLVQRDEGGLLVDGVGQTGYDITAKSEPWQRGYWETLMGCGRCAQHLDGWVKDTTRNISFPSDMVLGPSNPNPRPAPPNSHPAPLEENCVPSFPAPETFYMKILTTKGFTTNQRMQAALSYADWLESKGLRESARDMYDWALDIAVSGAPDANSIIDTRTGIIRESAPMVTSNILQAATSLATHFARESNLASALPIYLSVLRAQRSAPYDPAASPQTWNRPSGVLSKIMSILRSPDYPPAPPTGDEPLVRSNASQCEDAVLMTYIGEVLFASSPSQRDTGLRWTREAVDTAEDAANDVNLESDARRKCAECAEIGLGNWISMVRTLAREDKQAGERPEMTGWRRWLGFGNGRALLPRWDEEEKLVEQRLATYRERALREQYGSGDLIGPAFGK
jgi:hypothetical protein